MDRILLVTRNQSKHPDRGCAKASHDGRISGRGELDRASPQKMCEKFWTLSLFELISARYEKKSIIVTSNKMPGEWGTVFGDAAAATASLDRLLHHCTPMLIQGESYRTRAFTRKMRE